MGFDIWQYLGFMGMIILGFAYVIFVAWSNSVLQHGSEFQLRTHGQPALAVLVMANSQFLADNKIPEAPALTIFTREPPSPERLAHMRQVSAELFSMYQAPSWEISEMSGARQLVTWWVKDDQYVHGKREQVPVEMTDGHIYYMASTMLQRDRIPDHTKRSRALACLVTGEEQGEIMVLPHQEEAAQRIYQAIGAT